jgi:hypothetical protein
VASRNEEKIAIEIETGKSEVNVNILKSLNEGFNKIIIVPLNIKAKIEILENIKRLPLYNSCKTEVLELKELFRLFFCS